MAINRNLMVLICVFFRNESICVQTVRCSAEQLILGRPWGEEQREGDERATAHCSSSCTKRTCESRPAPYRGQLQAQSKLQAQPAATCRSKRSCRLSCAAGRVVAEVEGYGSTGLFGRWRQDGFGPGIQGRVRVPPLGRCPEEAGRLPAAVPTGRARPPCRLQQVGHDAQWAWSGQDRHLRSHAAERREEPPTEAVVPQPTGGEPQPEGLPSGGSTEAFRAGWSLSEWETETLSIAWKGFHCLLLNSLWCFSVRF